MSTWDLKQKVRWRIRKFAITDSEIDRFIELSDWRYHPDREPDCGEPYSSILRYITDLTEQKRYNLMCLMHLGRNIDYTGFDEEAVDDFCFYADEWGKPVQHGSTDPAYLVGKVRIGKWLRLAKEAAGI